MTTKLLMLFAFLLFTVGCGEVTVGDEQLPADQDSAVPQICVPGLQVQCPCLGGSISVQVCAKNGQGFEPCQCPTIPDSGNDIQADAVDGNETGEDVDAQAEASADADAAIDSQQAPTLEVALAQNTPAGMSLCQQTADVPVFGFTLQAINQDVWTNAIRIQRVGTGSVNEVIKLRLEISNAFYTGTLVDPVNGIWQFDGPGIFSQPQSATKLLLHADFNGISASQHAFQIQNPGSLDTVTPATVIGSFPVRGNTFTISNATCGSLSMTLASNPVSGTVVKKTIGAEVLGIRATAGINDIMIKAIPLRCQASIHGAPYAVVDCSQRVTSLAVFDGATQLGYAISPNTDGKAPVLVNYLVPNGATKTLTVKATFASTASADQPYDKISIGVDADMIVTDTVYNQNVTAYVEDKLAITQLSQAPIVTTTILSSGTLSIVEDNHPPSQIVVAGKDVWVPFAQYKATAQYEAAAIDRLSAFLSTVPPGGCPCSDNADFAQIAVASNGTVMGSTVPPSAAWGKDIDLTANPIMVPKDGSVLFQLWAKLAPVVANSINPAPSGVARSGHAPALGITDSFNTGEWDQNYVGKLNARTTGQVSGERIYAPAGAKLGNPMVIRKSKPILTMQNLANTVLTNGVEQDHYKWQLGADGTIAWKQIMFHVEASNLISFGNYRLYKGGSQLPPTEYSIMDAASGQDLKTTSWSPTYSNMLISFKAEQAITGSGEIYTLRATSSGPGAGQHMMIKPMGSPPNELITGRVQDNTWAGFDPRPDLFVVQDSFTAIGYFIRSDMSELPHNGQTKPSSNDWTTAWLIQDLTQSSVLSN